jgi:peptidyl-prolyl cis-trans isomerase B (cyclophilin B)
VFRERTSSLPRDIGPDYVLDRLTAAAADEDFVVAATGAELLAHYPHRLALTALAELWDRATGPEKADLQLAILGSLRDMGPQILALERPDTTGFNPDHLIGMTRNLLRESFLSEDLRTRYRGREAASATRLLPPELIPTRASLLATLPAFRRSSLQTQLSLPFNAPEVRCITSAGEFVIKLNGKIAPNTCAVFLDLVRQGFYDNLTFHRVVPDFVVQGGCPRGDGWGGPGYTIRSEWSQAIFRRGAVGIAHSGKDSGGSQFFITLSEQPHLNGRYTIFGEVTRGMEIVDRITADDRFRLEIMP